MIKHIIVIVIIKVHILCSCFSPCYTAMHPTVNPLEYIGENLARAVMVMVMISTLPIFMK